MNYQGAKSSKPVKKRNWTRFIAERQIFGISKRNHFGHNFKRFANGVSSSTPPLRAYRLGSIMGTRPDLDNVFLGFSIDGNYLFSYRELCSSDSNPYDILDSSNRTYSLTIWKFVPNRYLEAVQTMPLFDGEKFFSCIYISLEQRPELPDVSIVTGYSRSDTYTSTRSVWYTVILGSPNFSSPFRIINFHTNCGAPLADIARMPQFLAIYTTEDVIMLDLRQILLQHQHAVMSRSGSPNGSATQSITSQSIGDISENDLDGSYRFAYASQALNWCIDVCSTVDSTCGGLIDYRIFTEMVSHKVCEGLVFVLFDVDTNERCYFEAMFKFRWNLETNEVCQEDWAWCDVTKRPQCPLKQQQAFNATRYPLCNSISCINQRRYNLTNFSIFKGWSLQCILDFTGFVALTL